MIAFIIESTMGRQRYLLVFVKIVEVTYWIGKHRIKSLDFFVNFDSIIGTMEYTHHLYT